MSRRGPAAYDAVVVGSGFGGAFSALPLVEAGWRVAMVERGGWVERGPANWAPDGAFTLTEHYPADSAYRVRRGRGWTTQRLCTCVGGPSVFYGGASFRFRERDFAADPAIAGESGAAWPIGYADLEPFYTAAEDLLGVAGSTGEDPTEPPRSAPYPHPPAPLAEPSRRIAGAARALGLRPFRIPLAISGPACVACTTCDAFACAVGAKNDVATRVIPALLAGGLELLPGTVVARVLVERGRAAGVRCVDRRTGEARELRAGVVLLAAGALATPHLLLASGLERANPAGDAVGRFLMRHCNAMTYGVFRRRPDPGRAHHKQIALHDYYWGDSAPDAPPGKLGNLQQVMTPPAGLLAHVLPRPLARVLAPALDHLTGLLSVAEDQPGPENRVTVDAAASDAFGLPALRVTHRYSRRDLAARAALVRRARRILRHAGASATVTWRVTTFSHAVGTVRMGSDERTAPIDAAGAYRGVDGLFVVDGSVMPTSAAVNPSLTIAANALRMGTLLAGRT
jgi:choline dehydrogenase-like flavoprotein